MVQGDEKKSIFNEEKYKKKYIYLMKYNAFRNDVKIISYCIMDNHAHMLLFCPDVKRVSKMMSQCNTTYALYFNQENQKVGHVFRGRYKMEGIYTKSHLINCIKYIHENPVKAGICLSCDRYEYSSFNFFPITRNLLMKICNISNYELNDILLKTHTDVNYIDDEYSSKEDIENVFKEIKEKYSIVLGYNKGISKIYSELKARCRVSDIQIAKLLNMDRYKLLRILKKESIK